MAQAIRWPFWGGVAFLATVVLATLLGSWLLYARLMDAQEVPLKRLVVQGNQQYVTDTEVRDALTERSLGSFFSADVDDLRERVEALPWVDTASVRKEWPDLLRVYVVEQEPLGYWNDSQLMNQRGELFTADMSKVTEPLPYLYGPLTAVDETQEQFQQIRAMLELNGFIVRALRISERFAAELVLADGTEIRLGREARLERIQRFIDLYPAIVKQNKGAIDYVDLRYDTGVAVRWRETSDQQKDES